MADPIVPPPAVSPTGLAVVGQYAVKAGLAMVTAGTTGLAALQFLPPATWTPQANAFCTLLLGLGALLSGSGPGLRKAGTDAASKVQTTQDVVDTLNRPAP